MRFGRVLVSLLLLAGISVVGSAAPAAVADTPVSQGPPTCPPGGQPGDLGCPVDFEATISAAPPSLSPGSTISITRSIPYPPCATAESIDCYNRFSNPTFGGVCVYMNGGLSTDFRRCNVWLEINLSDRGFWVRPGTTSTTFACDALFNEAFYAGGSVDDTFAGIAPGRLPCEIQMRDDFTLQRLQGPTWMPWSFTYDVCEVAGERPIGNGFGCLQSRQERASTWVRLDTPEQITPEAGCVATATDTVPSIITVTDTSTLDTSLGDTLTSELFWSGASTTEGSATFEVDYPGTVGINVVATASPSGTESRADCSLIMPYPVLGGEMTFEPLPPDLSADTAGTTDFDVTVSVDVEQLGYGDMVLGAATVRPAEGLEILSPPAPSRIGQRLAWGDAPVDYTFRIRADVDTDVPVVFTLLNEHENGRIGRDVVLAETLGGQLFNASPPVRLLDTRDDGKTIDGLFQGIGVREADSVTPIQVTGRVDIPAAATAAALTVTAIRPTGPGFATLFPCDADQPETSSLNFTPGSVIGNSAMVLLSDVGEVCLYTSAPGQFTLDFGGWLESDPAFQAIVPVRLFESRAIESGTVDGVHLGQGRLVAGSTTRVAVAGRGGVSDDATAVTVVAAAIRPTTPGYVTLFPCGEDPPNASSLNYAAGSTVANSAMVSLSDDGDLCVFTSGEIDFTLDASGVVEADPGFQPLVPLRLLDTRAAGDTVDGDDAAGGELPAGSVTELDVAGRAGISSTAEAVTVNVTSIRPQTGGFVTLYPCDAQRPTTSSLNFAAGAVRGTASFIGLDGSDGTLCVYVSQTTHLTLDVSSAFVAAAAD